jgi:very-short-patch-repair endonuclease
VARQRARPPAVILHRVSELPSVDVTVLDGIPVTTAARTLIDLAAVVDRDLLEEALDDALSRKLFSLRRLRWRMVAVGGSGRAGLPTLRSLVDARQGASAVPQSRFETRVLRLLKSAKLPVPVVQHEVRLPDGASRFLDFAYPDAWVAIEADSVRWHSGRAAWERDLERRNALTSMGWLVLHVTWQELTHRPQMVVNRVQAALRRSGAG